MVGLALVTTRFRVKKVVILRAASLATVHRPVGRAIHAIGFGPADKHPVDANRLLALTAGRDRGLGAALVRSDAGVVAFLLFRAAVRIGNADIAGATTLPVAAAWLEH